MTSEELKRRTPFFLGVWKLAIENSLDLEDVAEELMVILEMLEQTYGVEPALHRRVECV